MSRVNMSREKRSLLRKADRAGILPMDLRNDESAHFCPDWDDLPICFESPEFEACTCDISLSEEFLEGYKEDPVTEWAGFCLRYALPILVAVSVFIMFLTVIQAMPS